MFSLFYIHTSITHFALVGFPHLCAGDVGFSGPRGGRTISVSSFFFPSPREDLGGSIGAARFAKNFPGAFFFVFVCVFLEGMGPGRRREAGAP